MIDRFEPPAAGADVDLFDEIEEQLAGPSLSAVERDEILDTELPRDVEHRQEVYRPAIKDSGQRSEAHPSELQSLMRHSYAAFCLTKKQQHHTSKTKEPKTTQTTTNKIKNIKHTT